MATSLAGEQADRGQPFSKDLPADQGAALYARRLHDFLTLPATLSPLARFGVVTLLDGSVIFLTLLGAGTLLGGPVASVVAGHSGASSLFTLTAMLGLGLTGLNWRSWRCISFQDCVALCAAVGASLAGAWAVCLLMFPALRASLADVTIFAVVHTDIALLTMFGMRALRRMIRDYACHLEAGTGGVPRQNILLLGTLEWIKSMSELVRADRNCRVRVVGALTFNSHGAGMQVGAVPVLGSHLDLPAVSSELARRGTPVVGIVVADEEMHQSAFAQLLAVAGKCDISVTRGQHPHRGSDGPLAFSLPALLERPEISLQRNVVERLIRGRRILITGAGGTIGSELVRQLASFKPAELILLDHCEFNLYSLDLQIRESFPDIICHDELCCVRERTAVRRVFERHQPDIVFHAAALKHVPMVESNPRAGVHTNVLGTRNVADAVCEFGALAMIQISTDKAVNPIGLMGATKRLGELYCQALDLIGQCDVESPRFMTVRFGNVLGSSGSLIPLFERQLAARKPLTVTHPDMERYFMTVGEAVQLILQSSACALETQVRRGTIFVLDMGDPIKVLDIARRMIRLAGLRLDVDIPIRFIGLRPGEKLFEELFDSSERRLRSSIPGIIEARPNPVPLERLIAGFDSLERLIADGDDDSIRARVHQLIHAPGRSLWAEALREMETDEDNEEEDALLPDTAPTGTLHVRSNKPRPAVH